MGVGDDEKNEGNVEEKKERGGLLNERKFGGNGTFALA